MINSIMASKYILDLLKEKKYTFTHLYYDYNFNLYISYDLKCLK